MWTIISLLCLLHSLFARNVFGSYEEGSVYLSANGPEFVSGRIDAAAAAAYGYYNNTLLKTGWGVLEVNAGYGAKLSDNQLMYAAGFLEGKLTAKEMWQQYVNTKSFYTAGRRPEVVEKLKAFLSKQDAWMRKMVAGKGKKDAFWRHVGYVVSQFDGLYDGYKAAADPSWDTGIEVVQLLNGIGDVIDLIKALDKASRPDYFKMSTEELKQEVYRQGHCSALIKVTGGFENLYMSHSSWFLYAATMRIYKHYDFNVKDAKTAAKRLSFSSYPGFIESLDDFYLLGSGMVMLQTTNTIFNQSLYDLVRPSSLLAWQRVRVANMMATSGEQWGDYLGRYNSGTYNNQYMVIDLKRIRLSERISDGALWVVEQIPGLVEGGDQTDILRTGYWASYNVPFYKSVYDLSGYPDIVKQKGLDFSYQLAPRAKIFRRDADKVIKMDDMKHIMRDNDYTHDPYSEDQPCDAICCRGDLSKKSPGAFGCYDTKVADFAMALDQRAYVISGPTLGSGLKPFSWTGRFQNVSHVGLPQTYHFDWLTVRPRW